MFAQSKAGPGVEIHETLHLLRRIVIVHRPGGTLRILVIIHDLSCRRGRTSHHTPCPVACLAVCRTAQVVGRSLPPTAFQHGCHRCCGKTGRSYHGYRLRIGMLQQGGHLRLISLQPSGTRLGQVFGIERPYIAVSQHLVGTVVPGYHHKTVITLDVEHIVAYLPVAGRPYVCSRLPVADING